MARPERAPQPDSRSESKGAPKGKGTYKNKNNRVIQNSEYDNLADQDRLAEQNNRYNAQEFKEHRQKERVRKEVAEGKRPEVKKGKEIVLQPIEIAKAIKAVDKQESVPAEQKEQQAEIAKEVDKGIQEAVTEQTKEMEAIIAQQAASNAISKEQAAQAKAVLQSEEAKKGFFSRVKDWAKDGRLSSFLVGTATGVGVRMAVKAGAIAAFGANLPAALLAGAVAGGGIEGVKAIWRESKTYNQKEIMDRFNNSGYLEKAAMLSKLEEIHKAQKFDASPEEYEAIKNALTAARVEMQAELDRKDGRFVNQGEREKIQYILDRSNGVKSELEGSNRSKEAKQILKDIEKSLNSKDYSSRDFMGVLKNKKMVVAKAALRGAAFGALGSTIAAGLGAVASHYLEGSASTVTQVVENKAQVADHLTQHLDHRGITGGARDALHNLINEQRGIDPNFAHNVNIEQLVYAEDTLAKEALKHGVNAGVHDMTWTHDQLMAALEKSGAIGDHATLTGAGESHIHQIIAHKPHFLSEATRAKMLDFNPQNFSPVIKEIVTNSSSEFPLNAADYASLLAAISAVLLSESVSATDKRKAQALKEELENSQPATGAGKKKPSDKFPNGEPSSPNGTQAEVTPIPKPTEDFEGSNKSKDKIEGPTQEEFDIKVAHYLNVKADDPKRYEGALADLQKYSKGKNDYIRDQAFPGWKDSDFEKLIKKLEESTSKNAAEAGGGSGKEDKEAKDSKKSKEKSKEEGESDEDQEAKESGKPEKKEAKEEGVTPEYINQKLAEAGYKNVEVNPWPKEKITEKQKARVEEIADAFIKNSKVLKELNLSGKIILDFYPKGEKVFNFKGQDVTVEIPLAEKNYGKKSFEVLINGILGPKIKEKLSEFKKDYKFKIRMSEISRSPEAPNIEQYKVLERLQTNLKSIDKEELERLTSDLKELTIADYSFIGDSEITLPMFIRDQNGYHYSSLKADKFKGILKSFHKDRRTLAPMDLTEMNKKYRNIGADSNFYNLDERERTQAEELMYKTIEDEFKDGFPMNVKVVLSDRFQSKPGVLYLDMSKFDKEYISRQLHQGMRRSAPDRLKSLPQAVKDRLDRVSPNYGKTKLSDQDKAIEAGVDRIIRPEDWEPKPKGPENLDNVLEENGDEMLYNILSDMEKKYKGVISSGMEKKITKYLKDNNLTVEDLLAADELPKITSVMPRKLEQYIAEQSFAKLEKLSMAEEDTTTEGIKLKNQLEEFIKRP